MAYSNVFISTALLASVIGACSKAPNYSEAVNSAGAQPLVIQNEAADHGDDQVGTQPTADQPLAQTPPAPGPPQTPPVTAKTDAERAKEMNARGFVAYAVAAPNGSGWNTAQTPYLLAPSVDAAGRVDASKGFNVYFCNYANGPMTIHSGTANGPMAHGQAFQGTGLGSFANIDAAQAELDKISTDPAKGKAAVAAMPNCRAHVVSSTAANVGATYNHQGGAPGNAASHIHFKVMSVDPQGTVK